jgi:hypothetical protein
MKELVICLCFLIVSCNNYKKPVIPENLISKDKMVAIIVDMTLLSSAKGSNKIILEANGVLPQEYVYKKHNIDSVQFALSNEYYAFNIDDYESIYNEVSDSLTKLKTHYKKIEEEELKAKRIADSIRRANKIKTPLDTTKLTRSLNKINRTKPKLTKPLVKTPDTLQ